jgi:oligopeptide/dipeptide ABC transporter ATP-binding protein
MDWSPKLLEINELTTHFITYRGVVRAVEKVSYDVFPNEVVGVVGETGSGKTVTVMSVLRLIKPPGRIMDGTVRFKGENLLSLPESEIRQRIRGREISMIFQKPMSSLNPVFSIGRQLCDVIRLHFNESKTEARQRAVKNLSSVALPDPEEILSKYPHELSGGMQQRVMIAMALACDSSLLIADEPTTALDVSVQLQILKLIKLIQEKTKLSVLLISHDLGVIASICDRINVMYAGHLLESGKREDLISSPLHPYSQKLIGSVPDFKPREKLAIFRGEIPDLLYAPDGCRFNPRCDHAMEICRKQIPELVEVETDHKVACHLFPG